MLPPQVPQYFVPVRSVAPGGASLVYQPRVLGSADIYFSDAKSGEHVQQQCIRLAELNDGPVALDWNNAEDVNLTEADLERDITDSGASFGSVPSQLAQPKSFETWSKSLADAMFRTSKMELLRSAALKITSKPGESERDFRVRLAQLAREQRDAEIEKLRAKYAPKAAMLQERIRKAEMARQVQQQQASGAKWQAALSVGASMLGGAARSQDDQRRERRPRHHGCAGVGRTMKESSDVARAGENVAAVQQQLADLESQLQHEISSADPSLRRDERHTRAHTASPEEDRRQSPHGRAGVDAVLANDRR